MIGEIKDTHGATNRNVRDLLSIPIDKARPLPPRLIQYETGVTMLPGSYVIKLLVRNASTGRMGTFEAPFTIPNLARETIEIPLSSVVLSQQRVTTANAVYTVKQKIAADAANPLVDDGQKLVPAVGRTLSANRPLYVFLQAYERDAAAPRPLAAYATFYRDDVRVLETPALGIDRWDATTRALPIRLTIAPGTLTAGSYTCQVTVIDPSAGRVAFRRVEIAVR
jgi:hypothetical protein